MNFEKNEFPFSRKASKFSPHMAGLDKTANRYVPDFDTAYKCLYDKNLIGATTLSCWRPFFPQFKKGFFKNGLRRKGLYGLNPKLRRNF